MPKRPRDFNQLAKLVVDIASGEVQDPESDAQKTPNRRGRAGGIKGGVARSKVLPAEQRSAIAKKAANSRWRPKSES